MHGPRETSFSLINVLSQRLQLRGGVIHAILFIRIYFIRISRLIFGSIFLDISRNIQLEIYFNVRKESFHPEMQFKAVFEGGSRPRFNFLRVPVNYRQLSLFTGDIVGDAGGDVTFWLWINHKRHRFYLFFQ